MTIEELKRAITLLKMFEFKDLLAFQQVLKSQCQYINTTIIPSKREQIVRILNHKEYLELTFKDTEQDILRDITAFSNSILSLQHYIDVTKKRFGGIVESLSNGLGLYFDGNIYQLPQEVIELSSTYDGNDTSVITVSKGQKLLSELTDAIKYYIAQIDTSKTCQTSAQNISSKINKIIRFVGEEAFSFMSFANKLRAIDNDIDIAKEIAEKVEASGQDLESFLAKGLLEIRGELGV